jgi:tripartite-type tricarboxylate transporter receptor subunit TctC
MVKHHLKLAGFGAAALAAAGVVLAAGSPAQAAWEPKKITIVLSHSLGGGQDRLTRAFSKVWSKHLGAKLTVKPKRGASGRIGFDYFVSQPRDGTVLLSSNIGTTSIMYVKQRPKWSWTEKVRFVGLMGIDPGAIFVLKDSKYKSIKDVIAAAKKGTVIMGLSSWDSLENMVLHSLPKQAGIKPMRVIPIGGGSDTVTAVLGKHLPVGFGKVSNIGKGGKKVRFLAVAMATNPVANLTGNAPTLDSALGTKTVSVASYRSIIAPGELGAKHPDRLKKLKSTFEAAKDDAAYIKLAKKVGVDPKLIVDWNHDKIQGVVEQFWASYQANSNIFKTKVKAAKAKVVLSGVKSKGKYILFKDKDGKKWKTRIHRRATKLWIDGKRIKGQKAIKKARKALKKGSTCEITYMGFPLRARTAKCSTKGAS